MKMIPTLKDSYYKLIRSQYLLPISSEYGKDRRIEDGYVLIGGSEILEVGEYSEEVGGRILNDPRISGDLEVIGSYHNQSVPKLQGVTMPAFVKAHGHDHESPLIGVSKDVPLTTWLDQAVNTFTGFLMEDYDDLYQTFGVSPYFLTYLKARCDDLYYGITSSMTHHCNFNKYRVQELVQVDKLLGVTNIIAVGAQDRNYDDRILDIPYSVAIDRLDEYYDLFKDVENVTIVPGPDQFFSNGPDLLMALKAWSREKDTLFHIHSSEEPNTTAWFVETYGQTPTEYGESIGVLDDMTVLAHQVNNTQNDLDILKNTGTKIVHNPLANTILGSGMPPVIEMMDMGIPVCISTDGSGSADNQNILNAARVASMYQKSFHQDASLLPSQKLLEMITCDAAEILQINKGSLEKGKDADVICIDLTHINMTPTLLDNVVENLIWASSGNEIQYVIANGKVVIDDYDFVSVEIDKVKKDIRKLTQLFYDYKNNLQIKISGTGVHQ